MKSLLVVVATTMFMFAGGAIIPPVDAPVPPVTECDDCGCGA